MKKEAIMVKELTFEQFEDLILSLCNIAKTPIYVDTCDISECGNEKIYMWLICNHNFRAQTITADNQTICKWIDKIKDISMVKLVDY